MDSVLNYPLYDATYLLMGQIQSRFKDPTLLGNVLENQDVPSMYVDPQSLL
ncbi:hypothetical protein BJV74DRAFT_856512 [Russula compacta]|nr:hypothetical protein BJV74DRAFT_856512 [Russula compacta]